MTPEVLFSQSSSGGVFVHLIDGYRGPSVTIEDTEDVLGTQMTTCPLPLRALWQERVPPKCGHFKKADKSKTSEAGMAFWLAFLWRIEARSLSSDLKDENW